MNQQIDDQRCGTCRFFERGTGNGEYCDCRRHAPIGIDRTVTDGIRYAEWPQTYFGVGCGDWKPKEERE